MRIRITLLFGLLLPLMALPAHATGVSLYDYAVMVDSTGFGDYVLGPPAPSDISGVDVSAFDSTTGLGTVSVQVAGAGSYFVGMYVDDEIRQLANGFSNEYGATSGMPSSGQSWDIGKPGTSAPTDDSAWLNLLVAQPSKTNFVPSTAPDDVSMVLGWDFSLLAGELATIDFLVGETAPTSGFYLIQTDPDPQLGDKSIYFSSTLNVTSAPAVPEPTTLALYGLGLAGLVGLRRVRG